MEASTELCDIIVGWFDSVARGDTSWLDRHISHQDSVRLIGTDSSEWLAGARAAQFLREEVGAIGGQVRVAHGEVEAYREGGVGWGVARPTITLPNGQSFSPRWSAVFHQENGDWKAVQVHASVGLANEQLFGE